VNHGPAANTPTPSGLLGPPRLTAGTLASVEAEIGAAFDPAEALALARDEVLAWLADTRGIALPDSVWDGDGFKEVGEGMSVEAVASTDPAAWLFRLRETEPETERQTILDLALAVDDGRAVLLSQSAWSSPADPGAPQPALPEPVRRIAGRVGLAADGRALAPTAWRLRDPDDLAALVALMDSSARRLPLVVLSEASGQGGGTLVDPDEAATQLLGLAHVVAIPFALSEALTTKVGKQWSVFGGAARVYRSDLDRYAGAYRRHPLLLPATFPGPTGPGDAMAALQRFTAAASVARASVRIAISNLWGRLTGTGLAGRLARASSDAERIELLQAEVRRLSLRIEEALNAAVADEARASSFDAAVETAALEAEALRARLQKVSSMLRRGTLEQEQGMAAPEQYQSRKIAERHAGAIDFLPAARRSLGAVMNVDLLSDALEAISAQYVPAQRSGRAISRFTDVIHERGIRIRQDAVIVPGSGTSGTALEIALAWDPIAETAVVSDIRPVPETVPATIA